MLKQLKQISSEIVIENPYWVYRRDKYEMPNGKTGDYHFVDSRGSVMVIPITNDNKILLGRQYRYLNSRFSIEFAGGGVKSNLSIYDNALAELREELGVVADNLEQIGEFNPFNGVTNEICNVFIAKNINFTDSKPDESEEFEILALSKEQIFEKIASGEIWDGMTIAAFMLFVVKFNGMA